MVQTTRYAGSSIGKFQNMVSAEQKEMTSRDKILSSVKKHQPQGDVSDHLFEIKRDFDAIEKFKTVLSAIGGEAIEVSDHSEMIASIQNKFGSSAKIVAPALTEFPGQISNDPHTLANVDLAVIKGEFGVGENGSVWVTDENMGDRALPFICQYLALFISKSSIVHTTHDAYEKIGEAKYEFGTFIAGPSKTADIEQSLVLGAHGAKGLTVYLLD